MGIYRHVGPGGRGAWTDSVVIVNAEDLIEAQLLISEELTIMGLKDEPLDIMLVVSKLIYSESGD